MGVKRLVSCSRWISAVFPWRMEWGGSGDSVTGIPTGTDKETKEEGKKARDGESFEQTGKMMGLERVPNSQSWCLGGPVGEVQEVLADTEPWMCTRYAFKGMADFNSFTFTAT